jgi:predicted dehydrogenase
MKIGILGSAKRGQAWEKHLRPLTVVSEVIISSNPEDIQSADACILVDDTSKNLDHLAETIKSGLHSYLVSQLPTDLSKIEHIYHAASEANVHVQFSHWPSLSPSTLWMMQQVPRPDWIQVIKENGYASFTENKPLFRHNWIDEVALIMKWMDSNIHKLEARKVKLQGVDTAIQIFLRFENGATASVYYLAAGKDNRHQRVASNNMHLVDCDVTLQHVRSITVNETDQLIIEKKTFDATKAAEMSVVQFLKAIQMNKKTAFSAHDALQTARVIEKVDQFLKKNA